MGGGQRGCPLCKAACYGNGSKQKPLRHGGAGTVESQHRDACFPQAEGGANALVEQIAGEGQREVILRQSAVLQGRLQGKALHFCFRLFPAGLTEFGIG